MCLRPHGRSENSDHNWFQVTVSSSACSAQGQVFYCKLNHQGYISAQKYVFHRWLRNQGCSFYLVHKGAIVSHCFPPPTLSSASEQTLKDLKRFGGTTVEVRRVDLTNWALRTSPKFTTRFKYQFHEGFDQIRDLEIPITLRPLPLI